MNIAPGIIHRSDSQTGDIACDQLEHGKPLDPRAQVAEEKLVRGRIRCRLPHPPNTRTLRHATRSSTNRVQKPCGIRERCDGFFGSCAESEYLANADSKIEMGVS
jgi:hypothetical protein